MINSRLYKYHAYGLIVSSEFEIKELKPCDKEIEPDLTVMFADLGLLSRDGAPLDPAAEPEFSFSEDRQVVIAPAVGAFVIDGLNKVYVERSLGSSDALLAVALLGPVFAILLHLRGRFVLHGSAILYDGKAYGFVGDKGAGKSTLAAMLLKNQDVELLTDDLLVISDELHALRGYPQMKLSDEAVQHADAQLGYVRSPPHRDFPKNQFLLNEHVSDQSFPIGGIFELRRASGAMIEGLATQDAIRVLLRFSYISRFQNREMDRAEREKLFLVTTQIAALGVVNRIFVPDRIADLYRVINVIKNASS